MIQSTTYLVTDAKVTKNVCKHSSQVEAGMIGSNLNKIEQHRHRNTIIFKVNGDCNVHLVVWRRPGISSKVQRAIVFLVCPIVEL